jgi:hypothetical protein
MPYTYIFEAPPASAYLFAHKQTGNLLVEEGIKVQLTKQAPRHIDGNCSVRFRAFHMKKMITY